MDSKSESVESNYFLRPGVGVVVGTFWEAVVGVAKSSRARVGDEIGVG